MKKIINHLKENWIKYGFETFVIMAGILSAFTLNNWNDVRKENIKSKVYIEKLINDIVADTMNITNRFIQSQQTINKVDQYFKFFESRKVPLKVLIDSAENVSRDFFRYLPVNYTFEDMHSSGNLYLLNENQRQSLMELSNYQEFVQIVFEKNITNIQNEQAQSRKYLGRYFSNGEFFDIISVKQQDQDFAKGLLHLHNVMNITREFHMSTIGHGKIVKQKSKETIQQLRKRRQEN